VVIFINTLLGLPSDATGRATGTHAWDETGHTRPVKQTYQRGADGAKAYDSIYNAWGYLSASKAA
jgi:hypothetical protein